MKNKSAKEICEILFFLLLIAFSFTITAQQNDPLGNNDILKMLAAKLGENVIIARIEQGPCEFDLSPEALLTLKKSGATDHLIEVMINAKSVTESQARLAEAKKRENTQAGGIEMVSIPGRNYSIGKYEVTQGQWTAVMGYNPSKFKNGDNYPVELVSWSDCQTYIRRLNQKTGGSYRLPTEAEWEYACRAGTTEKRYGEIDAVAWYKGNSSRSTHPVGQKQPNAYGLYDMLGNVCEWCQDEGVIRGGSWFGNARSVRASMRWVIASYYRLDGLGFRLASDNR